jgi:uncharacterized repeat protein (TIGR03803 family)
MDQNGNLYGTTSYGGAAGVGTAFKLTKQTDGAWQETLLYTFKDGADGGHPTGLLLDNAGNLYGATTGHNTLGSVYKLSRTGTGSWKFTVLHDFSGPDGSLPCGPLVKDAAGNLYGATTFGGTSGIGVVFEVTP